MNTLKTLGIIPARYASTRFPGKPLVLIQGKSMVQRVYEQVLQSSHISKAIVATDDQRIYDHVRAFGGHVAMTKTSHQSGTDRCAELAQQENEYDLVINIQGDEPFIAPRQIDQLVDLLQANSDFQIATLAKKMETKTDFWNPNIVKVVFDKQQRALYFSRSPIPHLRGNEDGFPKGNAFKHIGLYGFRRKTLLEIAQLAPSDLEQIESLEQLRWLDNGYAIAVGLTDIETIGIDTPEDLAKLHL